MFLSWLIPISIHFDDVLAVIDVVDDEIYHEAIRIKINIKLLDNEKLTFGLFHNAFVFEQRSSKDR
jgi:hypothetical protein